MIEDIVEAVLGPVQVTRRLPKFGDVIVGRDPSAVAELTMATTRPSLHASRFPTMLDKPVGSRYRRDFKE